jgi:hypothetical protein
MTGGTPEIAVTLFRVGLRCLGWMATFAMAACSIGMIVGWFF